MSDTYNTEKENINTAAQNTQNQANAASAYNPNIIQSALSNPSETISSPENSAAFNKLWSGEYTGPASFETSDQYTNAAKAANEANTKAQELGSTGGREQLLQDQFNVYGQGNKGLDTAILQSSSSFPTLQNQQKQFQSVKDYLSNTANNINTGVIPQAQNTVANNAKQAQTDFNAGITNYENQLNTEATAPISNNLSIWNTVAQEYANDPNFNLPVTQNAGVDIARYLTATPEERQKYAQLLQLANKTNTFLPTYAQTPAASELQGIYNSLRNQ